MNQYVTGAVIKDLREKNKITQSQLADILGVSDKYDLRNIANVRKIRAYYETKVELKT